MFFTNKAQFAPSFKEFTSHAIAVCNALLDLVAKNVSAKGQARVLDRPGMRVCTDGLMLELPHTSWFSIRRENDKGLVLGTAYFTGAEMIQLDLKLDMALNKQDALVQKVWREEFGKAREVVDRALASLINNVPMEAGLSWPQSLRNAVKTCENVGMGNPQDVAKWIGAWGSPQMIEALHVADGLANSATHLTQWKDTLLIALDSANPAGIQQTMECLELPKELSSGNI